MSDLSFVAGEFPKLAATSRETAEAVRSSRPEGGASAFASAMPGADLAPQMQAVEEKIADQCMKTGMRLEECADSLEAAERDFIAAEEENGQLIGSIMTGHSRGGSSRSGHSKGDGDTGGIRKRGKVPPIPIPRGPGGNPTPPFPGLGDGGRRRPPGSRGGGQPRREPNPFLPPLSPRIGRPDLEPMPVDPIITGPSDPRPLPKPAIELPEVPPVKLPQMGNPTPTVDPIKPLGLGLNGFSAELGG